MKRWRGLRARFVLASGLLVVTTIFAGAWTIASLSRLGKVSSETLRESDAIAAATARVSGGLEREDDALLLVLAGDQRARNVLAAERAIVSRSLAELTRQLEGATEQDLGRALQRQVDDYRVATDRIALAAPEPDALVRYHAEANPVLRRAVAITSRIREQRFEAARALVSRARDAAERGRRAVAGITLIALVIAVVVVIHLSRAVIGPIRTLTRGANAIREGHFDEPIAIRSADELGELAAAFNDMAIDLAEFRRTNVREVVKAKTILEATLAALPDAVALFDADGRLLSMNRTASEVFSAAGISVVGSVDALEIEGLDIDMLRRTIQGEPPAPQGADLTRTIRVESGPATRRLLPRIVPVPELEPGRGGAILLLYDVTELAKFDEMRSELIAVASHELQTPLTTLRMTLLMLRETSDELPSRPRELVTTALVGVEQLAEIVHEFLDLTRIEAGELRLNLDRVDIGELMTEAIERARDQAREHGVRLVQQIDEGVSAIVGDRRRLRSVLDNLLSNALKYSPPGAAVIVALSPSEPSSALPNGGVVVSVEDSGPGIPEAYRTGVFEKFFRLEQHLGHGRLTTPGAGIGLYMCRQIVDLHGGRIRCTSATGGGARFVFELPSARSEACTLDVSPQRARVNV